MEDVDRPHVVLGRALVRRVLVLADVDADSESRCGVRVAPDCRRSVRLQADFRSSRKIARHTCRALAVETESIDDGAIGRETEQARFLIAGLRLRSNSADLDGPEPDCAPRRDRRALFI